MRLRLGPSLRRELDSCDLVQSTLVKALSHFGEFAGGNRGSLMAWLARIAENEIRDQASYHGRERRDAARRVSLEATPEAALSPLASARRRASSRTASGSRRSSARSSRSPRTTAT